MVRYVVNAPEDSESLNALFDKAWPNHKWTEFGPVLDASLLHVVAYEADTVVGFLRVIGCGGDRGFVVGPTVHPDAQGQGVGLALLEEAATAAKERGVATLHVEFASELRSFYAKAGYRHTAAGIRRLR
jgi:GNAT superfamily N-acetyltransferase